MFRIRAATPDDHAAVERLLADSYPRLLQGAYPSPVLAAALPKLIRAKPELLQSGTYFLAICKRDDRILGAGGWTADPSRPGHGHIRHVATAHDSVRRGVGRAVLAHALASARAAAVRDVVCHATLPAVPFYRALGFVEQGRTEMELAPGLGFPVVVMHQTLSDGCWRSRGVF
ncbi:GNAT family N-acetyltransferase [Epibacterium sp. Ofav1-8]|uniref:GNAT family N-acetyltransferase n=1 Tax=Epibacterium sp. Ofav1-8 TaxID=2917735 RepID=UPI001EF4976C|nr:GNAT family N-acetyltransferase [Epibacterium sp. Ofav1-8]MCG7623052.1 GNAT family N-acetyltransferase [Epibacterium sp. Ofav1-8]